MLNGMEQMAISMLQKMTGLTPEQMQAMANNALNLLQSLDGRLQTIEKDIAHIKAYCDAPIDAPTKELENDGQNK